MAEHFQGQFQGVIKSFSAAKGFGFIASDEATSQFGCDVFLHKRQIGDCKIGDEVTFVITMNKDGKPQAADVQSIASCPSSKIADMPSRSPSFSASKKAAMVQLPSFNAAKNAAIAQLPSWNGVVKSFNPKTKYGFIDSPAASAMYGCDVFLLATDMGSFNIGDTVAFAVSLNEHGKPQASNLMAAGAYPAPAHRPLKRMAPTPSLPAPAYQAPTHRSLKRLAPMPSLLAGPQMPGSFADASQRLSGQIKSFSDKTGFGFIDCTDVMEAHGCDVFLLRTELGPFSVGDTVSFSMSWNEKGQPQARELADASTSSGLSTGLMGLPMPAPKRRKVSPVAVSADLNDALDAALDRLSGVIKSFHANTGYGFIDCPDAKAMYGFDVYFKGDHVQGECAVGDAVSFLIKMTQDGKPQARDVMPLEE